MGSPTNDVTRAKHVAIYARRSEDDADEKRSLDEQENACRRFVAEHGLGKVVRTYRERGSGVTGAGRPIFVRMIEEGERKPRPFDVVVVLDVSRFGRADLDETGYWRHRLRVAGIDVRYVADDSKLAGEAGPIMGAVLQVAANDQSRKTALRVAMGIAAAVDRGTWTGAEAPFGYRRVRSPSWKGTGRRDTRLEIVEEEAKVVRDIFEKYVGGMGLGVIATDLNDRKIRTRTGKLWRKQGVGYVLANPVYVGDLVLNGQRRGVASTKPKFFYANQRGPVRTGGDRESLVHRDAFPAIVDRATWDAAQRRREERDHHPTGGRPGLLTGVIFCGACGGRLGIANVGGRLGKKGIRKYVCTTSRDHGIARTWGACRYTWIRADRVDPAVLDLLRRELALQDPATLARDIRAILPATPKTDVRALEARRRKLAVRRRELVLADNEFERAALSELAAEDERLARQIEDAKVADENTVDLDAAIATGIDAVRKLDLMARDGSDEIRFTFKQLVRQFVSRLIVSPTPDKAKPVEIQVASLASVALAMTLKVSPLVRERSASA